MRGHPALTSRNSLKSSLSTATSVICVAVLNTATHSPDIAFGRSRFQSAQPQLGPSHDPLLLVLVWFEEITSLRRTGMGRPILPRSWRPCESKGRLTPSQVEPEQLPGPTKPASCKDGSPLRRRYSMEQEATYVGPGCSQGSGGCRCPSHRRPMAGRPGRGRHPKPSLEPGSRSWSCWRLRGAWRCLWWRPWPPTRLPVVVVNPPPGAGFCPGNRDAGQDRRAGCGGPGSLRPSRPTSRAASSRQGLGTA